MDEPLRRVIRPSVPVSLALTLRALRHGPGDPTIRLTDSAVWRSTRTAAGPATLRLEARGDEILVHGWGVGAGEALDRAAALVGADDDLRGWEPGRHPLVADLDRRFPGLRMVATGAVFEACVPAVLEQKVTSAEAHAAWRRMVWSWGEEAPGPGGLRVPPPTTTLGGAAYFAYHRFGVERRRAEVIRALARRVARIEEATALPPIERRARLEAFPGVGPWTSAEVAAVAWGDADAVSVGDYHLAPNVVYAFTGRRGGDDDAMLELLEPFRPHRGRVARLVMLAGPRPPRRAPRAPLRDFRSW